MTVAFCILVVIPDISTRHKEGKAPCQLVYGSFFWSTFMDLSLSVQENQHIAYRTSCVVRCPSLIHAVFSHDEPDCIRKNVNQRQVGGDPTAIS
ncbi:hypothetical protein ACFXTH_019280 [Malus domestica]